MDRNKFVQCPCCWHRFPLSETLWIAMHHDLKDDYLVDALGDKMAQQRFLPVRFTPGCRAFDERGERCGRDFACPHCHVAIPESYFNCEPMYVSIVGTTGAGKTFFLASLHHRLRQNPFKRDFGLEGLSYDSALYASQNRILDENVNTLFRAVAPPDTFVTLDRTAVGDHVQSVLFPEGKSWVALPFTYVLTVDGKKRALCLYDRQGGAFTQRGGIGNARHVFNLHLLDSDILFFLYDPTQNGSCVLDYAPKYGRSIYRDGQIDEAALVGVESRILNPDIELSSHHVFGAVANFVRQYSNPNNGLIKEDRYTKYICIIATKCDAWERCLPDKTQQYLREPPKDDVYGVIAHVSNDVEAWIEKHDPAFTAAVRGFAKNYNYIPVSAAGRQVIKNAKEEEGYNIGVEPLSPRWIDVPFLRALYPPQS